MVSVEAVPDLVPVPAGSTVRGRVVRWARRTEGRLALLLAVLVLLGVAAGVSGVAAVRTRVDLLAGIPDGAGLPALELYVSLADADATAAVGFLTDGVQADELARFRRDVARATASLTEMAAVSPSSEIEVLSTYLSIYADQIDDAMLASVGYLRPGFPTSESSRLSGNYLREPAASMRTNILPAARRLLGEHLDRLAAAQRAAAVRPWLALAFGVLLVAGLAVLQVLLTRWTRRLLNLPLLAATLAAVTAVLWLNGTAAAAGGHSEAGRRDGTVQLELLAEAKAAALLARSDDAMALITRDNGPAQFRDDYSATPAVTPLIQAASVVAQPESRQAVTAAVADLQALFRVHLQVHRLDRAGRPAEAAALITGFMATLSSHFDSQLADANKQAAERLAADAQAAREALRGTDFTVAVLMGVAVAGAVLGLWHRIAEYRMP